MSIWRYVTGKSPIAVHLIPEFNRPVLNCRASVSKTEVGVRDPLSPHREPEPKTFHGQRVVAV